ncbi:unnamed protein product [Chrysoparadoxa australica]
MTVFILLLLVQVLVLVSGTFGPEAGTSVAPKGGKESAKAQEVISTSPAGLQSLVEGANAQMASKGDARETGAPERAGSMSSASPSTLQPLLPSQIQAQRQRQLTFRPRTSTSSLEQLKSKGLRGLQGLQKLAGIKRKPDAQGMDQKKRWLHIGTSRLVFEFEGEAGCLTIGREMDCEALAIGTCDGIENEEKGAKVEIEGIFGIYHLLSGPYVLVILRSAVPYHNSDLALEFRQISKLRLIPVLQRPKELTEAETVEETRLLELLRVAATGHQFYFSHTCDVTHTLQRRAELSEAGVDSSSPGGWRHSDARFFWNRDVLRPLLQCIQQSQERGEDTAVLDNWVLPVTSGFLQVEEGCSAFEKEFDLMLVSRRSCMRQGCRYTRRGIDDEGNVANFVETEQALLYKDGGCSSLSQTRGSIPLYWSSPVNLKYTPPVIIPEESDDDAAVEALRKHVLSLQQSYGENGVVFVNLVEKKKDQGKLGEALGSALKVVAGEGEEPDGAVTQVLDHVWFDFHEECRNMQWGNLEKLMKELESALHSHGFLHLNSSGQIKSRQNGILRTNCMDCLDRTNVVQSLIGRRSILLQLEAVGAGKGKDRAAMRPVEALDDLELPNEDLEKRFRDVWGNNADELALLYAGTPALKGDFTRTGARTKLGILQDGANSVMRYVINNFQDHKRQEAVDLLLGVHATSSGPVEALHPDMDLWTKDNSNVETNSEGDEGEGMSLTRTVFAVPANPALRDLRLQTLYARISLLLLAWLAVRTVMGEAPAEVLLFIGGTLLLCCFATFQTFLFPLANVISASRCGATADVKAVLGL